MFTAGLFMGFLNPINISLLLQAVVSLATAPPLAFALYVLTNNLMVAFLSVIGGLVLVLPPFISFFNGVTIGSTVHYLMTYYPTLEAVLMLLPHSIFEIPALLIAVAIGIDVALTVLDKGMRYAILNLDQAIAKTYIVVLLLIVASVVETLVTYML